MTLSTGPTAIVDFAADADGASRRLWFEAPLALLRAATTAEVVAVIDEAERHAREGRWVVGFVSYEAAPAFDSAFSVASPGPLPLAWFAVFRAPSRDVAPTSVATAHVVSDDANDILLPRTSVRDERYASAVHRIHLHIEAGDVYQVNLTIPFTATARATHVELYERMRLAQGGAYACYLDMGDARILSASPELFFERRGPVVRSRPMKGTAPRGLHPAADAKTRAALLGSEKDRAENVMIVDVVRNDLGRIAQTGTVRVTALCEAERYPTVWQLTSTVEANVEPALPLSALFGALFPPASVTGAPKIRATRIIRELEGEPRGVYCGAIGMVAPGGNATFNVAIRTAWTSGDDRTLHLNAGGGVTIDSTVSGEMRELHDKLAAFTTVRPAPALFETIRVEHGRPIRLARHLARMSASAEYFGVPFDATRAIAVLDAALCGHTELARARLELSPEGKCSASVGPHPGEPRDCALPVALAPEPIVRDDFRLYHKTTDRTTYERALASTPGAFDVVLWNADAEVTELTRGNIVVQLGDDRVTPPVECGLLAGVLRSELLERGEVRERLVTLEELRGADRIWFVNALRGWVEVRLAP